MNNKNNTKKKVITIILAIVVLVVAILLLLKGCGPKEEPVVHNHSYKINEEGTWICNEDGNILSNTDKPYVAILEDNQPKDILAVDTLSKTKINLGNGTIYKDGNNIYYSGNNAQTIIIKTQKVDEKLEDKDELVINATNDTVYHYGSSTVVSLDAVATNSFHEYGKVDLITLTKARVVLENPSDVKEIYLDINDSNYSYETTIIALKEKVELPRLTRDAINLEEGEVKTLAIVQKLKDEVKTETNTETNEVIETVLEVQTAKDDYVKIENVRKSNDELIVEAFLSPNADEQDKTQTENQTASTITLEEAKEGSTHPASHNTFVSKEEKVIEVVKPTETKVEEPKEEEETKPVVKPTVTPKQEEAKPEEDKPTPKPSHSHSYGDWYDFNDIYHAKKCSCGNVITEEHIDSDRDDICDICHHNAVAYNVEKDIYYTNLYDAIGVCEKDGTENTIVLLKNLAGVSNKNYVILEGQNIVFDLNGYTFNTVAKDNSIGYTFENNGTLVIEDSSDTKKDGTGNGKLEFNALDPDTQLVPGFQSSVIINKNSLTIESGWIHNASTTGTAAFAIDNLNKSSLVVNGGKISAVSSYAIRQYDQAGTINNHVIINNGIFKSNVGGMWLQDGTNSNGGGSLTINGGSFEGKDAIQIGYTGDSKDFDIVIKNCKINGNLKFLFTDYDHIDVDINSIEIINGIYIQGCIDPYISSEIPGVRNGYITSAFVGVDYEYDFGVDLTGAVCEVWIDGADDKYVDQQYIHINGSVLSIDGEALVNSVEAWAWVEIYFPEG